MSKGFPDGWTEGISDTQQYVALGNAVTVPVPVDTKVIFLRLLPAQAQMPAVNGRKM